jgi:hypothetical protein
VVSQTGHPSYALSRVGWLGGSANPCGFIGQQPRSGAIMTISPAAQGIFLARRIIATEWRDARWLCGSKEMSIGQWQHSAMSCTGHANRL